MMKKICTFGAVCALILTACGKTAHGVQTSGSGNTDRSQQTSEKIQVEQIDSQVITVTSRETVRVAPDMAEIIYAVTTQNKDAAVCQNENSEKLN